MVGLRDIRRKSRRDLHLKAQVLAFYLRTSTADPVLCHIRLQRAPAQPGDVQGGRLYGAKIEDTTDKVIFDLLEIAKPERNGIVSIAAGEAYEIDVTRPPDDEFQTTVVVKLSSAKAEGLPVPPSTS